MLVKVLTRAPVLTMIVIAKIDSDATTPLTFNFIMHLHPSPLHQPQPYAYQRMSKITPFPPHHQGIPAVLVPKLLIVARREFLLHVMHIRTGETLQSRSSKQTLASTSSPPTSHAPEKISSCSTPKYAAASAAEAMRSSKASCVNFSDVSFIRCRPCLHKENQIYKSIAE